MFPVDSITVPYQWMKIKSGLVFDKHNGTLVGFTDLGSKQGH